MGFGTEILFLVVLGLVMLGPKRLQSVLAQVARAKDELAKASRDLKVHLETGPEGVPEGGENGDERLRLGGTDGAESVESDSRAMSRSRF